MRKIKRLNVLKFAFFQAYLMLLVGLLAGIIYSFGGFFIDALVSMGWVVTNETPGLSYGTILAFGALIGMPLIFGFVGLLFGLVEAALYNVFAGWFGGMEIKYFGN